METAAHVADGVEALQQSADERTGGDLAATSPTALDLDDNQLKCAAEIGQLAAAELWLSTSLTSVPAEITAHVADGFVARRQSADEPAGGDRAALNFAEGVVA